MRYFLEIQFRGTNYNGWQIQPNGITIQQKIDDALQTILRDAIHCIGCGRTDSGVHASQFFLHFDTKAEFPDNFLMRINAFLPHDISVLKIFEVAENAHARFDATQRIYEYRLSSRKDVFDYGLYYYKPFYKLNPELMQQAAEILVKYNNFPCFCKSRTDSKTTLVNIAEAKWIFTNDTDWIFYISANRFLRGMVRLIVGAMLQIGEERMTLQEFENGIQEGKRFKYALSAPAHALFLTRVEYPFLTIDKSIGY